MNMPRGVQYTHVGIGLPLRASLSLAEIIQNVLSLKNALVVAIIPLASSGSGRRLVQTANLPCVGCHL